MRSLATSPRAHPLLEANLLYRPRDGPATEVTMSWPLVRHLTTIPRQATSSSSIVLASFRTGVSKPSVNQP
jgi:hypothetical protein